MADDDVVAGADGEPNSDEDASSGDGPSDESAPMISTTSSAGFAAPIATGAFSSSVIPGAFATPMMQGAF